MLIFKKMYYYEFVKDSAQMWAGYHHRSARNDYLNKSKLILIWLLADVNSPRPCFCVKHMLLTSAIHTCGHVVPKPMTDAMLAMK